MNNENRKTKWGEAICMVICASLLIILFRFLGFGRISGAVLGGVIGAILGMGIYYLFAKLINKGSSL